MGLFLGVCGEMNRVLKEGERGLGFLGWVSREGAKEEEGLVLGLTGGFWVGWVFWVWAHAKARRREGAKEELKEVFWKKSLEFYKRSVS
jgi:hypothetical protein